MIQYINIHSFTQLYNRGSKAIIITRPKGEKMAWKIDTINICMYIYICIHAYLYIIYTYIHTCISSFHAIYIFDIYKCGGFDYIDLVVQC